MASDAELEVFRALRSAQDRYDYFLLAASGTAIAFALNQTHDKILAWSQVPLGLSVLCWGLSFYFGCRHLLLVGSSLYSNGELLKVKSGLHPWSGRNFEAIEIASEAIKEEFDKTQNKSSNLASWQFLAFIVGGVFYISWHVLEMYNRLPGAHLL